MAGEPEIVVADAVATWVMPADAAHSEQLRIFAAEIGTTVLQVLSRPRDSRPEVPLSPPKRPSGIILERYAVAQE